MKSRLGTLTSWRKTMPIWIGVSLISALLSLSPPGQWIEQTIAREWLFQLRDVRSEPKGVAIVSMDERAGDLPAGTRSDRLWSRTLYAMLIDRLSAAGAAAIVMDVTFEEAGEETSDNALEQSLAGSNRAVIFQRLTRTSIGDISIRPLRRFESVVKGVGVFPLPKQARVDGYWPFFPTLNLIDGGEKYKELPSLPVAALQIQLLHAIGASPFEQLLDVRTGRINDVVDTRKYTDVSSLIDDLRNKFISSQISDKDVDNLIDAQTIEGSPIGTMLQSFRHIYSVRGLLPLNFYGPPRTIKTLDHMTVLSEATVDILALEQAVSKNVVFIGHSARSAIDQMDGIRTIYTQNGLDLSGVEIAATAYANLADGSYLRPATVPLSLAIHVLLGVVCAVLAFRASLTRAIALTMTLAIVYLLFCVWQFTYSNRVLPVGVPLLILLPVTLLSTLIIRYFSTNQQVGFYRQGIHQLLPQRVTSAIEKGEFDHSERQPLHGICMITDIENFTHFAEKLGHERISSLTHEYFSLTLQRIVESGGELFSVDGDGVTVFWGSQEKSEESKHQATSAAVEIMQSVNKFNQQHAESPFVTRIGLESGWVEARYIGSEGNYRYCLVGDTANTSSRLEGLNKRLGTSILATSAVVARVDDLFKRPVGIFLLKGKSNALEVFEIIDSKRLPSRNERVMCRRFAELLELIKQGELEVAENKFVIFLQEYEDDGPARFYLDLLKGHNSPDVRLDEHGVVHVHGK